MADDAEDAPLTPGGLLQLLFPQLDSYSAYEQLKVDNFELDRCIRRLVTLSDKATLGASASNSSGERTGDGGECGASDQMSAESEFDIASLWGTAESDLDTDSQSLWGGKGTLDWVVPSAQWEPPKRSSNALSITAPAAPLGRDYAYNCEGVPPSTNLSLSPSLSSASVSSALQIVAPRKSDTVVAAANSTEFQGEVTAEDLSVPVCKYFVGGHCRIMNCAFRHTQQVACKFFMRGHCVRGDACHFLHTVPENAVRSLSENVSATSAEPSLLPFPQTGQGQPRLEAQSYRPPVAELNSEADFPALGGDPAAASGGRRSGRENGTGLSTAGWKPGLPSPARFAFEFPALASSSTGEQSHPNAEEAFPSLADAARSGPASRKEMRQLSSGNDAPGDMASQLRRQWSEQDRFLHASEAAQREREAVAALDSKRLAAMPLIGPASTAPTGTARGRAGAGAQTSGHTWVQTGDAVAVLYEDWRSDAAMYARQRNECFRQAAAAFHAGDGAAARRLSRAGRDFDERMKELHALAAANIFKTRQRALGGRSAVEGGDTIDLHGLHVTEALQQLGAFIAGARAEHKSSTNTRGTFGANGEPPCIYVLVGTGHHSLGGQAKVAPAVKQSLRDMGLRFRALGAAADKRNKGMLQVFLE